MPVNSRHPDFEKFAPQWKMQRDAVEGELAVKAAREEYLPKLGGQEKDAVYGEKDYSAYLMRASYYAAPGRTVDGLTGYLMSKQPEVKWPEAQKKELEQIGIGSESLAQLLQASAEEVFGLGRVVGLVDGEDDVFSVVYYYAENLINWRTAVIDGERVPVMLVFEESYDRPKDDDPFVLIRDVRYRVLKLTEGLPSTLIGDRNPDELSTIFDDELDDDDRATTNLVYSQEIWERVRKPGEERVASGSQEKFEITKVILPRKRGGKLADRIPAEVCNDINTELTPRKGPILDLVCVALSHFRSSADLEHGRHFTALPTAWAVGFGEAELRIGSQVAWTSTNDKARAGYLEFTGAGLGSIAEGMKSKESLMAVLGARLLEQPKAGVEASETVKLRHAGDKSVLATIAGTLSRFWTRMLQHYADWSGTADPQSVSITFSQDFMVIGLEPQMLVQLMLALQSGLFSFDSWFYNLKRGELIPDGRTMEDEIRLIQATGAIMPELRPQDPEEDQNPDDKSKQPPTKQKSDGTRQKQS